MIRFQCLKEEHITIKEKHYKIWKVTEVKYEHNVSNIEPGKVLKVNFDENSFDIKTYDGIIRILKHSIDDLSNIGEYI